MRFQLVMSLAKEGEGWRVRVSMVVRCKEGTKIGLELMVGKQKSHQNGSEAP